MDAPWRDPAWISGAHTWIEEQTARLGLARTGAIEQPHIYPWSTVMRVPTAGVTCGSRPTQVSCSTKRHS